MDEFKRKIVLVISGRSCLTAILFVTIYFTNFFGPQQKLATIFYTILLIALLLNLFLLLLNKLPARYQWLIINIHLLFDLALVNFIVFTTGGTENPFYLLYVFIIMYSSLFLSFSGIMVVTGAVCISFLSIKFVYFFVFSRTVDVWVTVKSFIIAVEVNFLGFLLVGLLTGFLVDRLRVTRLKMAQQSDRIQDLKEYNESILSSLRSGLLTTDKYFAVVKINETGLALLNSRSENVLDQNALDLFQLNQAERSQIQYSTEGSNKPVRLEKWLRSETTAPVYMGLSISPLIIRDSMEVGYIIIFQDLTEIKRMENEIEIQRKMAAIGNLSAAIAHEIRNPLASMVGSIQVLKNQLNLTQPQSHLMEIILRESHRLDRIISDFLQFASTKQFSPRAFDLHLLLQDTLLLFKNSPELKDSQRIRLESDPGPMNFHGDPDQMKQVFWNLCTNAIKAMPTGGDLLIRCLDDGKNFIIEFDDTGRGMQSNEMQQLFEPFRSNFPKGLGLGMAIVYRIVTDHGGKIEVQSTVGQGTSIKLLFPKERTNV
jgi:two-component system sensor histidine kinase PilS (NtrC family)